jgi:hypothetical protein
MNGCEMHEETRCSRKDGRGQPVCSQLTNGQARMSMDQSESRVNRRPSLPPRESVHRGTPRKTQARCILSHRTVYTAAWARLSVSTCYALCHRERVYENPHQSSAANTCSRLVSLVLSTPTAATTILHLRPSDPFGTCTIAWLTTVCPR